MKEHQTENLKIPGLDTSHFKFVDNLILCIINLHKSIFYDSAETPLVEEASKGSNQPNMPCMEAVKLHPKKPPACTPEGAYAPRQCRGEVCFCVTLDGRPIPYYKVIRKLADSMECSKYIFLFFFLCAPLGLVAQIKNV